MIHPRGYSPEQVAVIKRLFLATPPIELSGCEGFRPPVAPEAPTGATRGSSPYGPREI